jgi:hypothetical protein
VLFCRRFAFKARCSWPIKDAGDNDRRGRDRALHHKLTAMRHSSKRPIIERLPHIAIKDIAKVIPRNNPNAVYCLDNFGLRYGGVKVLVSTHAIRVDHQQFRIKWVRTGFGRHRPLLICGDCKRSYQRLYEYHGRYACKHCHKADYLCQRLSKGRQRLWKAARLRTSLMDYRPTIRSHQNLAANTAKPISDSTTKLLN